jgi:hypothetical protein
MKVELVGSLAFVKCEVIPPTEEFPKNWEIRLGMSVDDVTKPGQQELVWCRTLERREPDAALIKKAVLMLLSHEVEECLRIDDKTPFDAHDEDSHKRQFDDGRSVFMNTTPGAPTR